MGLPIIFVITVIHGGHSYRFLLFVDRKDELQLNKICTLNYRLECESG